MRYARSGASESRRLAIDPDRSAQRRGRGLPPGCRHAADGPGKNRESDLRHPARLLPLTIAFFLLGPGASFAGSGLRVLPPWSRVARPGAASRSAPQRVALPGRWAEIQRARLRQWHSFPDLLVDPRIDLSPHFGARRGWRAPLEHVRGAGERP